MEKEKLFQRIQTMISSSTKKPKYITISSVKVADIFGAEPSEIDEGIQELVNEGRLIKSKMTEPPNHDMYLLP